MKYNKIFVFLFILICFTSIAYSADETLNNVFNEANDVALKKITDTTYIPNSNENNIRRMYKFWKR